MKPLSHASATAAHYNSSAKYYDEFNEKTSKIINHTLETILKKYKIKTVLDLTCGTGSQVFWLLKQGYHVTGIDINLSMLRIAKSKAKKENLKIKFIKGDMRHSEVGQFDAAITLFNAIGHLTKRDFECAIQNIYRNLKSGGIYVFDINNLAYLLKNNNICNLTIDWQKTVGKTKIRKIQYSTIFISQKFASSFANGIGL